MISDMQSNHYTQNKSEYMCMHQITAIASSKEIPNLRILTLKVSILN